MFEFVGKYLHGHDHEKLSMEDKLDSIARQVCKNATDIEQFNRQLEKVVQASIANAEAIQGLPSRSPGPEVDKNMDSNVDARIKLLDAKVEDSISKLRDNGTMRAMEKRLAELETIVSTMRSELKNPAAGKNREQMAPMSEFKDPAAGKHHERISKLEASMEQMLAEVFMLKKPGSSEGHEANPEESGAAPDSAEAVMSADEEVATDYALSENTWDLVILIGVPGVGTVASVFMTVIFAIAAGMQLMLCFIINDVFTSPDISEDDVGDMMHWRVSFGHSVQLMNPYTFEPYARGVCRHVGGIQMLTQAVTLLDTIEGYMPPKAYYESQDPVVGPIIPYTKDIGMFLSTIAVMIWILTVSTNILDVRGKILAYMHTTRGGSTVIVDHADSRAIKHLTTSRKLCCIVVGLAELLILVLLGFSGTYYIIYTLALQDLLLNCSALVIVLDVSSLAFASLVPQRTKSLMASLDPLPRPNPKSVLGLSPSSWFSMLLIIVATSLAAWVLSEQGATLEDVRKEICGGNTDFIAMPDGAGVITAGFDEVADDPEVREKSYSFQAIRQLVTNAEGNMVAERLSEADMSGGSSGIDGGPWSLLAWTGLPVGGAMEYWNAKCVDMLPTTNGEYDYGNHFLHILQDAHANYDLRDCTDVAKWCNDDTEKGVRARQACAATCGCNDPGPRTLLLGNSGCSPTCPSTPAYNKSMWSRSCTDMEVGDPYWSQYARSLVEYLMSYGDIGGFNMTAEAEFITSNGCDIVSKRMPLTVLGVGWADPCTITSQRLKPFTHACPVSCNCKSDEPPLYCPARC